MLAAGSETTRPFFVFGTNRHAALEQTRLSPRRQAPVKMNLQEVAFHHN
jgi:hypothetical protein